MPRYINQSIDEYLEWCETGQFPRRLTVSVLPIDRLRQVQRFVDPAIVRPLIKAMLHGTAVDCEYLSIATGDPEGG